MAKVSVIVPVYNAEKYLKCCMDSVTGQTLGDIEIICVNDGSTDGSAQILEAYAEKDNRIRVIHKENGGLVSARKTGVAAATGEYAGYVDSDDWIEPDMYEKMYAAAHENKADLVSGGFFFEGNYTTVHTDTIEAGFYVGPGMEYVRNNTIYRLDKRESGLRASLCYKLFLRERIQEVQCKVPDNLTMAEDKMCLLTYILDCRSLVVLDSPYYHYRINTQSMTQAPDTQYLLKVNAVYQYMLTLYAHPGFSPQMRTQAELYMMELLLKGMNTLLGFRTRNLLWFDPYWLDQIPDGSRIVLYGAGEAGRKCRKQLRARKDLQYAGCIDFDCAHIHDDELEVREPGDLDKIIYDYIVITIKNPGKAQDIRNRLEQMRIPARRILWFEQKEFFWRFAEAEGLLGGETGTV